MNKKVAFSVLLLVGGFSFLMIRSSGGAARPHYQLAEFSSKSQELAGVFMTLYGQVKEGSIQKKGIQANFILEQTDSQGKHYELPVHFNGKTLLPDTFTDGAMASLDGYFDKQKQIFIAEKIMAKCASRYEGTPKP